jgi:hypothetical protein
MDAAGLLALFDKEQRRELQMSGFRREVTPGVVRHISLPDVPAEGIVLYSRLDAESVEATIREQVAYFEGIGQDFEWKVYDHDTPPDLLDRLAAHGFIVEDPEAFMVLDLDEASPAMWQPVKHRVRQIRSPAQLDQATSIHEQVWNEDMGWLSERLADEMRRDGENLSVYVAYVDDVPACSAWIRFHPPTAFAGLWGGSTLPRYRERGLYTALVKVRAQEARRRGCAS